MPEKILVVDDEETILQLLTYNLEKAGYQVVTALNGTDAIRLAQEVNPDLIVLDVMLPGMDGFEVCRTIRRHNNVPVLMLTARTDEVDRVVGLELGADDYVIKPFSPRELVARVKAILRRTNTTNTTPETDEVVLQVGDLRIDPVRRAVTMRGSEVDLTYKEYELLRYLASRPGRVFDRDSLLSQVWGYDFIGDTRTVDVHIRHLREKIEPNPAEPEYLLTMRGVGYRFREK